MAFRMASPYRHPKTRVFWFRKAVPKALQAAVGATIFQRTLETKDPDEARSRFVQVAADVQEHWAALSVVPDRLTPRARLALAGEFYRWSVAQHTEDPGAPGHWENRIQNDLHRLRPSGGRIPAPWMVIDDDLKSFLAERKLHVADADMWDLVRAAADAAVLARRTLLQQAQGDYGPNPEAERFPAYVAPTPSPEPIPDAKRRGEGLADARRPLGRVREGAEAVARHPEAMEASHQGVRGTPRPQEPCDGHSAGSRRLEDRTRHGGKLSNKTIGDGYLAALRTFYNCGIENGRLASEPLREDQGRQGEGHRGRTCRGSRFRTAPVRAHPVREPAGAGSRTSPRFAAARRWIPWLCAYTGARVNEMTQLRKQDLIEGDVDGTAVWQIRITPSAGTVKGNKARDVPVHPHLVEQGFIDFVSGCDDGPLFYDPKRPNGGSRVQSRRTARLVTSSADGCGRSGSMTRASIPTTVGDTPSRRPVARPACVTWSSTASPGTHPGPWGRSTASCPSC